MFLKGAARINQKELVGLMKACFDSQTLGKDNSDTVLREFLKCLVRTQQQNEFADELATCRDFIDASLCRHYMGLRKSGVKPQTWLESNLALARLLMEDADIQAVMQAKGDWKLVATQVARLVASSNLGYALFGYAELLVCSAIFEEKVGKEIEKLVASDITTAAVREAKTVCEAYTGDLKRASAMKGQKRHVNMCFLGQDITVTLVDLSLEVHLRMMAAVKELALKQGQLPRLAYEDWLLQPATEPKIQIEEELLQDAKACRVLAADMLKNDAVGSFQDMKTSVEKNANALCSLDSSFRLELAFVAIAVEDLLKNAVSSKLLELLPSEQRRRSLTQSLAAVQDFEKTEMMKMCPPSLRALASSVEEILANMLRGMGPEASLGKSSDFYHKLMRALAFFVSEGEGDTAAFGAAAMKSKYQAMEERMKTTPGDVTLGDLEVFQTYRFLLTPDMIQELARWVKQTLSSSVAKAGPIKPKEPDRKANSANVMAYFG